jgi:hypothetical protein
MKSTAALLVALLSAGSSTSAFLLHPPASVAVPIHGRSLSLLQSVGGKGFGSTPEPPPKKSTPKSVEPSETLQPKQAPRASSAPAEELNAGQQALEQMRRERAEQKDDELRKVRELMSTDQQLQETPAAIPEKVAQRMGKRMLPFVGLPLFLGLGTFVGFWYFATYKDIQFETSMVAATTIAVLVLSLVVRTIDDDDDNTCNVAEVRWNSLLYKR